MSEQLLLERIAKLETGLRLCYSLASDHILVQPPDPTKNGAFKKLSETMRELALLPPACRGGVTRTRWWLVQTWETK